MMRRTASTQVCLDWWPGRAGLEQWRLLQPGRPVPGGGLRPAARARIAAGHLAGRRPGAHRRSTTGCCAGDDPVSAYAALRRRGATPIRGHRGAQHLTHPVPARPPARPLPRGALPRRAAEDDGIAGSSAVLAALRARRRHPPEALRLLAGDEHRLRAALGRRGARLSEDVAGRGRELVGADPAYGWSERHERRPVRHRPARRASTPDIDASIGLMAATQDLGADVWACEPEDLAVVGGRLIGPRPSDHAARRAAAAATTAGSVDSPWHDVARASARSTWPPSVDVDAAAHRPARRRALPPHDVPPRPRRDAAECRVANRPAASGRCTRSSSRCGSRDLCPETVVTADPAVVRDFVARVGHRRRQAGRRVRRASTSGCSATTTPPRRWPSPPLAAVPAT